MKNYKKLIILAALAFFAAPSFSQTFGLKAGLNLSNMLDKDNDETYSKDYKMKPGFQIGPTAEFKINEKFSFQTGILFSSKGFKMNYKDDLYEIKQKVNLYYLDIPLNFKGTFKVGSTKIFATAGPYIGLGISGNMKYEGTIDGEIESDSEPVNWGSDKENDDLKRLDFGLSAGAGLDFGSFMVGLSYNLGLANISTITSNGNKAYNRVFGLSFGYKFIKS